MKTIKNLMALGLFTALFLLVGCSESKQSNSTQDILKNAGEIHNMLLDNYYSKRINQNPTDDELISELINLSSDFLIAEGFDQPTVIETKQVLNDELKTSKLKGVMNQDYSIDPIKLEMEMLDLGIYSDEFIKEVRVVISMLAEDQALETISTYINSGFASLEFENESDISGQLFFSSIFNSSYMYWTENTDYRKKSVTDLDPTTKVILNDGIGGLLGLVFGPVGVVITGTLFSAGTNEEIRRKY